MDNHEIWISLNMSCTNFAEPLIFRLSLTHRQNIRSSTSLGTNKTPIGLS